MKFSLVSTMAGLLLLVPAGCKTEVDDKPAAEVSDVSAGSSTPAAADANAVVVPVIREESRIGFVGAKVTGQHVGEFEKFDGRVELAGQKPSRIDFEMDVRSVETDTEKLTKHLKSADFFDVATWPKATFVSTKIESAATSAPDAGTHRITGILEMKGIKKEVSFPATIHESESGAHATAEFTINRHDWGVSYKGAPDDLIRDNVLIKLDLKFAKTLGSA